MPEEIDNAIHYEQGNIKSGIDELLSLPEKTRCWNYYVSWRDSEGWWHTKAWGIEPTLTDAIQALTVALNNFLLDGEGE